MEIPVANIYHLLSYAWDYLEEAEIVGVDSDAETDLADLFARVLINGTNHLFRRGLDRGYVEHNDAIAGIRGKLQLAVTVKQNLLLRASTSCLFDELTVDVPTNQILKATLASLRRMASLAPELREQVRDVEQRLAGVSEILLTATHFRQLQFHCNNRFYAFLLAICRFIFDHLMIDERTGAGSFRDFVRDESEMRLLFQSFVFNFYRRRLTEWLVSAPTIDWFGVDRALQLDAMTLPLMKTDVVLTRPEAALIIDTKFTPRAFASHFDRERARSGHLYQIFAYVKNYALAHPRRAVSGMLLYPVVDEPFGYTYALHEHSIRIASLDLRPRWVEIESRMLELLQEDTDGRSFYPPITEVRPCSSV